ncbi:MAG: heat-inducible transcriptional repressor HrcA [Pseudomonadales bacterium]|nr:heat-inducible transcriptional repressor HrcA [Pseudomonadales bacterium]
MKPSEDTAEKVDARSQGLFKMLVESYICDGVPVASKALARSPGVSVSPATVRNIMAELESKGLVKSPHTSAGKVPTNLGFRFFVDSLISIQNPNIDCIHEMEVELNPDLTRTELVESASHILARITRMAGVVTVPRTEQVILRQVEFLPLSDQRVLVILVVNERDVQNRVIHTERAYTESELHEAANFINMEFAGLGLSTVRDQLIASMQSDKSNIDNLMQTTMDVASKAFQVEDSKADYVVSGRGNLLQSTNTDAVRALLDAFAQKQDILQLLDHCLGSEGIQLFIGEESGYQLMDEYSLVTAPYQIEGQVAGVLGVIGPTRMAYQTIIPVVDVTAKLLGSALNRS